MRSNDPTTKSSTKTRPSTYLRKACTNCRRRKMRCDGERPCCRRCRLQPPRSQLPCRYSHGPIGGVMPPDDEPEFMNGQEESRVVLSDPYAESSPSQSSSDLSDEPSGSQRHVWGTSTALERKLPAISKELLETFLRRFASNHFLFLSPRHFQSADWYQSPWRLSDLLPSSLLYVIYLWAVHTSPDTPPSSLSEEQAADLTAICIARELSTIESPNLFILQSEVLLSLYYLEAERYFEGSYHCAAATSLALSLNLHQLSAPSPVSTPSVLLSTTAASYLDTPSREHVNAFWSVVILNNYWVAASGIPSSIASRTPINIPWPTASDFASSSTRGGYDGDGVNEDPPFLSMLLQASHLFQKAVEFAARDSGFPHSPEFWGLENRVESLLHHLPLSNLATSTSQQCLVSHIFASAAIIRLCSSHMSTSSFPQSKCIAAANGVALRLAELNLPDWDYVDPILGPLLLSFVKFGVARFPFASRQEIDDLHSIIAAMRSLASRSRLIDKCLALALQEYDAARTFSVLPGS